MPAAAYQVIEQGKSVRKQGGPIAFVDLEAGVAAVGELLEQRAVILLCACAELRRCHRLLAAEAIAAQYGVLIEHH